MATGISQSRPALIAAADRRLSLLIAPARTHLGFAGDERLKHTVAQGEVVIPDLYSVGVFWTSAERLP